MNPSKPVVAVLKESGKRLPKIRPGELEKASEVDRQRQMSVFHVSGSLVMLPKDQGDVVDESLRVYGTKNLRVVDASIFQPEPSRNMQSVVYAVAEWAAYLIRKDRGL